MNEQQLREELAKLDKEITRLQNDHSAYRQDLANLTCPYKVGDRIPIKGWSHTGKTGEVIRISGNKSFFNSEGYGWRVVVAVVRADGTLGKNHADWRDDQDEAC
jgi:hypothetical protein